MLRRKHGDPEDTQIIWDPATQRVVPEAPPGKHTPQYRDPLDLRWIRHEVDRRMSEVKTVVAAGVIFALGALLITVAVAAFAVMYVNSHTPTCGI